MNKKYNRGLIVKIINFQILIINFFKKKLKYLIYKYFARLMIGQMGLNFHKHLNWERKRSPPNY